MVAVTEPQQVTEPMIHAGVMESDIGILKPQIRSGFCALLLQTMFCPAAQRWHGSDLHLLWTQGMMSSLQNSSYLRARHIVCRASFGFPPRTQSRACCPTREVSQHGA